jgi:hypothetical protein
MDFYIIGGASAVAIAFVYMMFDIFNRRNVPEIFAYATLAYSIAFMLWAGWGNPQTLEVGGAIGLAIMSLGYLIYKAGQLGLADVFEFAALSMLLVGQPLPLLAGIPQFGMPFAASLLINTGIIALVLVPIYYIPKALGLYKRRGMGIGQAIDRTAITRFIAVAASYSVFGIALTYLFPASWYGILLLAALILGSSLTTLFERPITMSMTRTVGVSGLEEGDIIAFNLMSKASISASRARISSFERLVTKQLIAEMRAKKIRTKFPVYKNAIPLALPIFLAVVAALLFGNLILLII